MPHSHHSHSGQFCRHAKDQLEDIIKEAIRKGFKTYGLSEHAPRYRIEDLFPEEADMTPSDLQSTYESFLSTAISLRDEYASQIQLLISLETDYITDIDLARTIQLIDQHEEIDYIVGSVHHVNGISIDFDKLTWIRCLLACQTDIIGTTMIDSPNGPILPPKIPEIKDQKSIEEFQPSSHQLRLFLLKYFDAQYEVLRTFKPEVVGHLDLCLLWIPNVSLRDNPELEGVWEKVERNVRYIIEYGGLIEANSAALRKGWETSYPGREIVRLVQQLEGRICLSDDSHGIHQVGLNYSRMREYLLSEGVKTIWYLVPTKDRREGDESVGRRHRVVARRMDRWDEDTFWDRLKGS